MPAPDSAAPRRKPRYRRRLRTRIILSFLLLAFATNLARARVEDQLVEDVMNKNIDEYARRFYADPTRKPAVPLEQIRGRVVSRNNFGALRLEQPEWYAFSDGIHN